MAITPLPAQGSASWYQWASDIDAAARGAAGAVPDASTTVKGIVELATTAETQAGTDTVRAITPAAAAATYVAQANAIDLEATQDSVAGMFTGGTHSGISFAYDDPGGHINATVTPGAVADATTTSKGAVQLAGDLAGTAAAPTVPGKAPLLTPTATKTAAYTAVVGDLAMMNVAGGGTTLTLPTAPANKSQVGYRAIGATSGTPLTVNRGGTDTIGTTGATSASVIFADETVVLQYDAPNTRWLGVTSVRSQASMDARYDLSGAASTAQAFAIQRANHTGTQSADTLTDGTTNKAFLATERTKLAGIATGATAVTVGAAGAGAAVALSSTDASVTNARTPTAHTHPVTDLTATGTRSSTTFLRGDNTWATPAGGGGGVAPLDRSPLLTGAYAHTFDRSAASVAALTLTSGQPRLTAVTLYAGEVVASLTFVTGATGASSSTHQWAVLCDSSGTVLGVSADDTSATWSGATAKTFTLGSSYSITTTGVYYVGVCVVATNMPTLMSLGGNTNLAQLAPFTAVTAPTGATTPPSVSSSIGTLAFSTSSIYTALS